MARVCALLGVSRASYYRVQAGEQVRGRKPHDPAEQRRELRQRVIDLATAHPVYGHRKVWALLREDRYQVSPSTVYRWLKAAGLLQAQHYQRERREQARARERYVHRPQRVNELWQIDITYVWIPGYGMRYVFNVVDYHSRYVLASRICATHTTDDAVATLQAALAESDRCGHEIGERITLVSDNGPQFISRKFRQKLQGLPFRHIRARSHHPQTTGMVERYHQSLKYEEIWLNEYVNPCEAATQIEAYRRRYNTYRPHEALNYAVPADIYMNRGDTLQKTA